MPKVISPAFADFIGTDFNDSLTDGFENDHGDVISGTTVKVIKANGMEGNDVFQTGHGNDLAAGDMVGDEWTFVDGKWVYEAADVVVSAYGQDVSFDDVIMTGRGDDVLLGNGGHDVLNSGAGDDIINAGTGDDTAFGGNGNDILNLEDGDDYAEAGYGDDIVNAGKGNDVVYGDIKGANLLAQDNTAGTTFKSLSAGDAWTMTDSDGDEKISQSAETEVGETYTISFDLAANLSAGRSSGAVDVIWNGSVIDTVEVTSGAFETFTIDVVSTGEKGDLSFQVVEPTGGNTYNFDGPIITYDKDVIIGGADVSVTAFAAGQAKLYQVIDGQLNVFDVETKSYVSVGEKPNFKINAVGFNIEEDLIYGVAKSNGTDSLGNSVSSTDIVMIDAAGDTFRIGEGFYGDYVGDFDNAGNLWTFQSALNRVSVTDVNQLDVDGNPAIQHFKFPSDMFQDRTYDLAFNAEDNAFYAVVSPTKNGQDGKVVRIDLSEVANGGQPTFEEVAITGTLYGDDMAAGMAKGAYGAVFMDGEANLYYGLNKGDHDLDQSTGVQGAIFKVNVDWETGQAYSEFMSEAPSTGSNDGAVVARSVDAFSEVDAEAAVLLRQPALTLVDGGNDILRGGAGNDELHGNEGNDDLSGGTGDDMVFGDQGNDKVSSGTGNDFVSGGTGDDKLRGESGHDTMQGDAGNDFLDGGTGNDFLDGGAGEDKIVGGTGADEITGGAGNDHLWGGAWKGDSAADAFVFNSGAGKDYVHDFETEMDVINLASFDTDLASVKAATTDLGWATVIDLQDLDGGQAGDRIVLKSVAADDLSADSFVF